MYLNDFKIKFYNVFVDKFLNIKYQNSLIYSFFFIWIFEWLFIFEYNFLYYTYSYLFFPYRLPLLLLVCFLYFIYVWGVSVWRRTQYGRFTRGDRRLWFKGFASFWIVEVSTLFGVVIMASWMNWGPQPLFPRSFYVNRKSFIIETTFFTYILWLLYLMRYSMKWNKWKVQIFITSLILVFISYVIWRDILIIIGRDNIGIRNGCRWRHITTNFIIYTLTPNWWITHFIDQKNNRDINSLFYSLKDFIKELNNNNIILPFSKEISLSDYDKYNFLPLVSSKNWLKYSLPYSSLFELDNFNISSNFLKGKLWDYVDYSHDSYKYYPRRLGFQPKKLAMWTFFFFLKMWHHLMLFIWWFLYLIRLYSRKKNSYTLLSICHFNVYCCFLISLTIFIFGYFPWLEIFFRLFKKKYTMHSSIRYIVRIFWGLEYIYELHTSILNFKFSTASSYNSLLKVNEKWFYDNYPVFNRDEKFLGSHLYHRLGNFYYSYEIKFKKGVGEKFLYVWFI